MGNYRGPSTTKRQQLLVQQLPEKQKTVRQMLSRRLPIIGNYREPSTTERLHRA